VVSLWVAGRNVIESAIAHGIWVWGERPLSERYGRCGLITRQDLERAERWFHERGEIAVVISRLLPGLREFVSLPAGIARMPFWRFCTYTFIGAFVWCLPLTWVRCRLGPKWEHVREKTCVLGDPIAALALLVVAWYVWHEFP
jgi:membrane protein DedA with SNARE-associated domain